MSTSLGSDAFEPDRKRQPNTFGWLGPSPRTALCHSAHLVRTADRLSRTTNGVRTEIDHILMTRRCLATQPTVLTRIGEHVLCGHAGSISDHAALVCDLECVP